MTTTTRPVIALALLSFALAACGSSATEEPAAAPASAPPAPLVVFDEAEVMGHLGIVKRGEDEGPEGFETGDVTFGDYRWEGPEGTICILSNVITSAGEAGQAGEPVLNPAGTAGVEFYVDMENAGTCAELLTEALADFPTS